MSTPLTGERVLLPGTHWEPEEHGEVIAVIPTHHAGVRLIILVDDRHKDAHNKYDDCIRRARPEEVRRER